MSRTAVVVPEPHSFDSVPESCPTGSPPGHPRNRLHRRQRTSERARNGPKGFALRSPRAMTSAMVAAVLVVLALSVPAAAPTATSATWPSKRDARRVAVRATAVSCRAVAWCTGYNVVPAHRCRRAEHRTVYCAIAFVTAQRQHCGGVVGVRRTRRGRLDQVMAVPEDCSAARPPDLPPTMSD
jgi:hypothetical protein